MKPEDYPAQEAFTPIGARYHETVSRLGEGLTAIEAATGDDPYQSLAVHPAAKPDGTVLAFVHGGGWTNGYKEWMAFMAPALNAQGVTFVSIGYRLAPRHLFPVGVEDVIAGLAWIHREIAAHGGDPARIFIGGHSAGGHYTALLAVRDDWQASAGLPGDLVRGCLPVSGVYDFGPDSGLSMRPRFLGPEGNEDPASPISRIAGRPPPFLMAHGDRDFPHLILQAERMEAALSAAGGRVERLVLDNCDHLGASYRTGEAKGAWLPRAVGWMAEQ
jgi:acetyl esterase/lipase